MKKLNFAIFGALLTISLATQALADTTIPWTKEGCESVKGTWITAHLPTDDGCDAAHCNGMNFCRSSQKMNWWSALIWCKSIGRELTDIETACPKAISSSSICQNLYGPNKTDFWTTTPASSDMTYKLGNSGREIQAFSRSRNSGAALCK